MLLILYSMYRRYLRQNNNNYYNDEVRAEPLLTGTTNHVARACLLASCSSGSSDWLNALPLACVGFKTDSSTVRLQLACVSVHRLTAHMSVSRQSHSPDTTVWLIALAPVAIHGTTRSTICNVVPYQHTGNSWTPSHVHEDNKWPDSVTQMPWKRDDRCLVCDNTCPGTILLSV